MNRVISQAEAKSQLHQVPILPFQNQEFDGMGYRNHRKPSFENHADVEHSLNKFQNSL